MARASGAKITLTGLLALILFCCTSCIYVEGCDVTTAKYEREVPLSGPLEPGSSFAADTSDGSISLEGSQANECALQAKIAAHARTEEQARELAEQIEVRLEPAGKGLRLAIDRPPAIRNAWFSVSIRGNVPAQTDLDLQTSDGSIDLKGITGKVEATTSDGGIDVRDIEGDTRLRTSDGSIACAHFKGGTLDCHTGDGRIEISAVTAALLAANSSDGSITLENVQADTANVRTVDGSLRLHQVVVADADCRSSDGTIHIEYSSDAPKALKLNAMTTDGSITVATPPGLSAVIDAGTDDGSIQTDLPITIRGKVGKSLRGAVGGGEGKIYLRTSDGSITIR